MKKLNLEKKAIKKEIEIFLKKEEYYKKDNDAYCIDEVTKNKLTMRRIVNCNLANVICYE